MVNRVQQIGLIQVTPISEVLYLNGDKVKCFSMVAMDTLGHEWWRCYYYDHKAGRDAALERVKLKGWFIGNGESWHLMTPCQAGFIGKRRRAIFRREFIYRRYHH